jgi:hypothetical protein
MKFVPSFVAKRCSSRVVQIALLLSWAGAVALGFVVLMGYQNAPGRPAEPPPTWPEASSLQPVGDDGTLMVFAHPHCPCTRATMGELERVLRYVQDAVTTYVLFVQPDGYSDDWVRDDLWQRAAVMPGVTPVRDPGGMEAARFGAFTSGQVLYFGADRQLHFAGGITGSRGHEGDNKGRQALLQWIQEGRAERSSSFVFGCALQEAPMNAWKTFDFGGHAASASHDRPHPHH